MVYLFMSAFHDARESECRRGMKKRTGERDWVLWKPCVDVRFVVQLIKRF